MASKEKEDLPHFKHQPTSPLMEAMKYNAMFQAFEAMGLKPKGKNTQELDEWIQNYAEKKEKPKLTLPTQETGAIPKSRSAPNDVKPTVISSHPPKVRCFSGGESKGDLPFDIWRYDVKMTLKDPTYTTQQKEFAIRRSLTGSAARLVMYQGFDKPIEEALQVLDSVYGSVDNKEQLLAEFYSARQHDDEDVTTWSNRLQEILGKGLEKGIVSPVEMNSMLHAMLYTGLRQELKDISGHKYDTVKDFNQLRVALRQLEKDHQPKKSKPNTAKAITPIETTDRRDIEDLKGMVQQLTHTVTQLKEQQRQPYTPNTGNSFRGNSRGGRWNNRQQRYGQQDRQPYGNQHQPYGQPSSNQQQHYGQPSMNQQQPYQPYQQQQFHQQPSQPQQPSNQPSTNQQGYTKSYEPIICRRCGQEGHIQRGCRVRLDHLRQDLNCGKPMPKGQ